MKSKWSQDVDAESAFKGAMRLQKISEVVGFAAFVSWFLFSWFTLDEPLMFQRMGAYGILVGIIALTLSKAAYERFETYFSLRDHYQMRERVTLIHNKVFIDKSPLETVHKGADYDFLFYTPERPLYEPLKSSKIQGRFVSLLEIVWLCIATAQWGFGDLFACSLVRAGASSC